MKKFKFSLSTVLSYKQQVLGALQGEHAAAIAKVHAQEEKLQKMQQAYEEFAEEYRQRCLEGIEIREALECQAKLRAWERDLKQESEVLHQLHLQEEQKRAQVVEAKKDTSALEKLREKKRSEYDAEIAKGEEQFIEEFVSSQRAAQ